MPENGLPRYCPEGCDPKKCDEAYAIFSVHWNNCLGNPFCEAQVLIAYKAYVDMVCQGSGGGA